MLNMKLKNNFIKYIIGTCFLAVIIVGVVLLKDKHSYIKDEVNPNIHVKNIQLLMKESQVNKLIDANGEYAPCVYGYEYNYEDENINIGYHKKSKKVRRLTVKNEEYKIFGISKGMSVEEATYKLKNNEFVNVEGSTTKFIYKDIQIKLISNDDDILKGVEIQILNYY